MESLAVVDLHDEHVVILRGTGGQGAVDLPLVPAGVGRVQVLEVHVELEPFAALHRDVSHELGENVSVLVDALEGLPLAGGTDQPPMDAVGLVTVVDLAADAAHDRDQGRGDTGRQRVVDRDPGVFHRALTVTTVAILVDPVAALPHALGRAGVDAGDRVVAIVFANGVTVAVGVGLVGVGALQVAVGAVLIHAVAAHVVRARVDAGVVVVAVVPAERHVRVAVAIQVVRLRSGVALTIGAAIGTVHVLEPVIASAIVLALTVADVDAQGIVPHAAVGGLVRAVAVVLALRRGDVAALAAVATGTTAAALAVVVVDAGPGTSAVAGRDDAVVRTDHRALGGRALGALRTGGARHAGFALLARDGAEGLGAVLTVDEDQAPVFHDGQPRGPVDTGRTAAVLHVDPAVIVDVVQTVVTVLAVVPVDARLALAGAQVDIADARTALRVLGAGDGAGPTVLLLVLVAGDRIARDDQEQEGHQFGEVRHFGHSSPAFDGRLHEVSGAARPHRVEDAIGPPDAPPNSAFNLYLWR